jgi:peptide/nickel transport system substrate-binding protein
MNMGIREVGRGAQRLSRRSVLRGTAAGAIGLGLAGCTSTTETPTVAPAATAVATAAPTRAAGAAPATTVAQPKRGGTVKTMATTVERNLEPHSSTGIGGAGGAGAAPCYSNLLTYKWGPDVTAPSYIPAPDLAESWAQPDDLTYVFKLRPGAKWHNIPPVNGRELVAEDIIYSFNRVRDQKTFASFLAGIVKMEAVDKSTLKLTLDKPNADILNNLAVNNLAIVARERVEQTGGSLDDPPLIGSGPFILDVFEVGQRVTGKRNPDYFLKGQPYVDGFESLRVTADPSLMLSAFRAGTVNVLMSGMTVQLAEDIHKAVPTASVGYVPADRNTGEVILNIQNDLFKDVRVRQAISKAIDRKTIVDTVWLGRGGYTAGLSLPDPSYGLADAELTRLLGRDVAGAKQLLSQAGVSNLSFEIIAPTYLSGAFVSAAELIQANLREIGVTTSLKTVDTPTLTTAQQSGNFQATIGTFAGAAPNGWLGARYKTGGGQNWAKYADPEMDRMIDQQAVLAKDPEGRKKVLQDVQRKIIGDAVYIPLVIYPAPFAQVAELRGFYPPTVVNAHSLLWTTVWLDK